MAILLMVRFIDGTFSEMVRLIDFNYFIYFIMINVFGVPMAI